MPAPVDFKNRYVSTGGEGWNITEKNSSLPSGINMGAVAGTTDGGFGGFDVSSWEFWLKGDGEVNWDTVYMFGYKAIDELSQIGKAFTKSFYNMSDTKLWAYFDGCSEGGREGWSQVQIGANLDGAVIGAPGMHFSFQQIQHLWSQFVEYQLNYYPPYCELEKIVNLTTEACDHLDGRVDGVVARTDMCKLHFDLNSTVGEAYSCDSSAVITNFMPYIPSQNGTVTAEGVAVAREILNGAHDNLGRRIYVSYQPTASFQDAQSAQWVEIGLNLLTNVSALSSFEGVTRDTFRDWIATGFQRYYDSLETTWPDLSVWHNAGGKVLHYHGESDPQVPTAGSVRYYESVRSVMYPDLSYNQSVAALNDWYRLFLIPGGAHCGANSLQPNAPWPESTLATLIDWVEKGIEPKTLNGTVQSTGAQQQICGWPLRPYWINNGTKLQCAYDQRSLDTWKYDLNAFKMPTF
ncbi:tannase and feruloyl esterase [Aspergillus uvarum CBS 121591]|uniref:Carboxylic ester hydrolase n=1 Tax=Aspergillus uvarum CBS 121591 TaxID=1448315 RepID=A0A319C7N0_9EURO|nr:tannase and feruloyl esterase [Aspergillus uvarum CBS 121591]PYH80090.1 tannase and feruloyl esterase [Aspergillus uvarum CBS 121591]